MKRINPIILVFQLLILLLACSEKSLAQPINKQIKDVTLPSPNAGSLGKYVDLPVEYSTGIPSINIPIHTITYGSLSVPVSLIYHAGGVKLNEPSSWVGLNWSLTATGMISRTIAGKADEQANGYYVNGANIDQAFMNDVSTGCTIYCLAEDGTYDFEPDIYSVSYPGGGFKFYFNHLQKIIKINNDNTDSVRVITIGADIFAGFEIIDGNGVRYIFGQENSTSASNVELTTVNNGTSYKSGWYLTKIYSPDNKYALDFDYTSELNTFKSKASRTYSYNTATGTASVGGAGTSADIPNLPYWLNSISAKRLIAIRSMDEKIEFHANTARLDVDNGNRLDSISIYPISNGNFCKRFIMNYGYFVDNAYAYNYAKRLKLNSIQEKSCDQSIKINPTIFDYFGNLVSGNIYLPHRMSNQVDHWGYYNGKTSNDVLDVNVPSTTINSSAGVITYGSANRSIDTSFVRFGTLSGITWPLGGNTLFKYEANTATSVNMQPTTVVNLSTCGTPTQACCGALIVQSSPITFSSSEIVDARFNLNVARIYGSTCQNNNVSVTASIWNGATQIGTNYSFNIGTTQSSGGVINQPLSVFGSIPAGTYTFKLQSQDGRGELKVNKMTGVLTNYFAPGLRIKRIIIKDNISASTDKVIDYDYIDAATSLSSGKIQVLFPGYATEYGNVGFLQNNAVVVGSLMTWSDMPVNTLPDYGASIIYGSVKESISGNGYTLLQYNNSLSQPGQATYNDCFSYLGPGTSGVTCSGNCPTPPYLFNGQRGKLVSKKIYNETNQLLLEEINTYISSNKSSTPSPMIKFRAFCYNGVQAFRQPYYINSVNTYLQTKSITQDGVTTTTNYTYDALKRHPNPITSSFTNSDGKVHLDSMYYIFSYPNVGLRDSLKKKNMINSPYKAIKRVDGIKVDGSETEFAWFDKTTGAYQATPLNSFPRAYKFYRDEYTWNSSNVRTGSEKVLQSTIGAYDSNGNISSFTQFGWDPETYEWFPNGTLKKRTFNSHVKQYSYYPSTALLNVFTDIDGQAKTFEYDKLGRFVRQKERANNIITDVFYNYKSVSDPNNWLKIKKTFTPVSGSNLNVIEEIQYLDGLGRPMQTVKKNQANGIKDLVVDAVLYDNKGRVVKKYLPFQSNVNTGAMQTVPVGQGFTQIDYEPSPLNRISSTTPPAWYASTVVYGNNVANEVKLTYGVSPTYYSASALTKETKTDASNRVITTFKDKKGRIVLIKSTKVGATSTEVAETYSVYDDKDRLKNVFPPESNNTTVGLFFDYRYDQGDNIIYKKVPDQAAIDIIYDDKDLMTFYKDGNLSSASYNENGISDQWMMTKYDNYGRPTGTGFYTSPSSPAGNNAAMVFSKQITWQTYGTVGIELGKIKSSENLILGNYSNSTTKISESYTYDTYGRISNKVGNNHLNSGMGNQSSYFVYDLMDNVIKDSTIQITPAGSHKYATRRTFDYIGRPVDTYHRIVNGAIDNGEKHISKLSYNFKGELITKYLSMGNYAGPPLSGQTFLQKIDYYYNPQGWLTKINDPYLTGTIDPLNPDYFDAYRQDISYDAAPIAVTGLTPNLDKSGNISQLSWQNKNQDVMGYNFDYNYLGHVINSKYFEVIGAATTGTYSQKYNENLTYDNRGNILSLYRNTINGAGMLNIDNLSYGYVAGTNRLNAISDASGNSLGFNVNGASVGYTYDNNGNYLTDPYKKITTAKYYFNNLPKDITVNQGIGNDSKLKFTYTANGTKLRKQVLNNSNTITNQQDYFGKIEYIGTTPVVEAIYHPEGRAVWNGSTWRYEFNITDHLGNVRAVISDLDNDKMLDITTNMTTNEIINVNSYYPFGMTMAGTFSNNTTTLDTRYQYNGKEMNSDLGLNLLDYGARWYDASIGRWGAIDPLASDYPNISPYAYVANNPIKFTDPTGAYIVDQDGNKVEINKDKDGNVSIKGNLDKGTANILNAMISTPAGLESATNLVSMDDEVRLQETSEVITDENGDAVHGVTTAENNKDGEFSHYNIKISTASIGDRMDNFSNAEKLNIIGTHEETHIEGGGNLLHDEGLPVSRELESRFQYSKLYPDKSDPDKNWRPNYESYLGKKEVSKIESNANKSLKKN